jgi:hypothetical protein
MGEMKILIGRGHLEYLRVDGKIILKLNLKIRMVKCRFICRGIGTSGGLL